MILGELRGNLTVNSQGSSQSGVLAPKCFTALKAKVSWLTCAAFVVRANKGGISIVKGRGKSSEQVEEQTLKHKCYSRIRAMWRICPCGGQYIESE